MIWIPFTAEAQRTQSGAEEERQFNEEVKKITARREPYLYASGSFCSSSRIPLLKISLRPSAFSAPLR